MAAHRYWRILFRDGYHAAGEVDLGWVKFYDTHEPDPDSPASTGGTAISGENYSSTFLPSKSFNYSNGETADNWASDNNAATFGTTKWIGYDFGEGNETDVQSYSMSVYTLYFPKSWDLQWSDDASTWTTAHSWDSFVWSSNTSHFFRLPTTLTGPGRRYWRFLFTGALNTNGTGEQDLQEADFRTEAGVSSNLASTRLTITSDARYDSLFGYTPRKAFDGSGDSNNRFASGTAATDHWLLVDFGERVDIVEAYVKINNTQYVRGTVKVQSSDDREVWSDRGTFPSGWTTAQAKTLTIASAATELLRRRPVIACC